MVEDIVMRERLLEHHQIEFVQALEHIDVGERVGRIRVAHQPDIAEFFAHALDHIVIPVGRDLDLDALIAGVELGANLFQKLLDRILNADRDAAFDLGSGAAEMPPERDVKLFASRSQQAVSIADFAIRWPRAFFIRSQISAAFSTLFPTTIGARIFSIVTHAESVHSSQ